MKKSKTLLFVLCLVLLSVFSECMAESLSSQSDYLQELVLTEKIDLMPKDFTGYRMAIASNQVDLNTVIPDSLSDDGRVGYFNLSEVECRSFFKGANPISIGPNNAVLWLTEDDSQRRMLFVERNKVVIPLSQAVNRGAKDVSGVSKSDLDIKLNYSKEPISDTLRWSPDGRYVFLNNYSRWNALYTFVDPYIIDTISGEIFLVETDSQAKIINLKGYYQYITNGRFSKDSLYFVYSLAIGREDAAKSVSIRKYNIESETISEIYRTEKKVYDFCEMENNKWVIIEEDDEGNRELVRLSSDGDLYNCEYENINTPSGWPFLIPVNDELVLLHIKYGSYYSSFIKIERDKKIEDKKWYVIQDAVDEKMTALSVSEVNKREEYANPSYWTSNPGFVLETLPFTSCVLGTLVDDKYPLILLRCAYNREISNTWNGMKEMLQCIIALNAETFEMYPVIISSDDIKLFSDEVVYDNNIIILGSEYSFDAFSLSYIEGDIRHWYEISQSDEGIRKDEIYSCTSGSYVVVSEEGPIEFSAYCIETEGVEVDSIISAKDNEFMITNTFLTVKDKPEYIIPRAISVERYNDFTSKMSKVNRKRTSGYYQLITPAKLEKRADAEDLLKKYPKLSREEMYVLKDEIDESMIDKIVKCFEEAGYDYEEYLVDLENVVGSIAFVTRYPVEYSFVGETNISRTEVLRMAGLCDIINSAIYKEFYRDNSSEKSAVSNQSDLVNSILQSRQKETKLSINDLILSKYIIDGNTYSVKILNVTENDKDLEFDIFVKLENDDMTASDEQNMEGESKHNTQDSDRAAAFYELLVGKEQIIKSRHLEGELKRNAQDWEGAVAIFESLGEIEEIKKTRHMEGESKRNAQDWDGAVAIFESLGEIEEVNETRFLQAKWYYDQNEFEKAYRIYRDIITYSNVSDLILDDSNLSGFIGKTDPEECIRIGEELSQAGNPYKAVAYYRLANDERAISKYLSAACYKILGRWNDANGKMIAEFREDTSCEINGENFVFWVSDSYTIKIQSEGEMKVAFRISNLTNDRLTIKDLREGYTAEYDLIRNVE